MPRTALARSLVLVGSVMVALIFGASPALAAYTAQIVGGTLQITGNAASDKLALRLQSGVPTMLDVDVGDDGTADFSFDRGLFTAVNVTAGGGKDLVRVDQSNGAFTDEAITIDGGPGNDTLLGGSGVEIFLGGEGDDFIDGNQGSDVALLGAGDDTFHWDPGDGSDTVEGQEGSDVLDFNGSNASENIDVSANGGRVRFTRDVAAIVMDLNGVEGIVFHAFGGADMVTVNDLTGTDAKSVEVDLAASGGGGDGAADTVVVNGTAGPDSLAASTVAGRLVVAAPSETVTVSDGESANDAVHVAGGSGNDVISVHGVVSGLVSLDVDGEADTDTTQVEGTKSADSVQIVPNGAAAMVQVAAGTPVNSSAENLIVFGLGGSDTIAGSNGLAVLTSLTIDGGKKNDILLGGDGADVLIGGAGNDLIDANRGDDLALMGEGKDTFHWDPGDGSDTVEGQEGSDVLDFNGSNASENIDVSANGGRVRFTRDVAAIVMDLNGVEGIVFHAFGGADMVTVNDLTGTDAKSVEVDLAASGGGGDGAADTVVVNGTAGPDKVKAARSGAKVKVSGLGAQTLVAGAEPANDTLRIQTQAGDDTVSVASIVFGLIQTIVDLGPDS